jgi:hypothetical protein
LYGGYNYSEGQFSIIGEITLKEILKENRLDKEILENLPSFTQYMEADEKLFLILKRQIVLNEIQGCE